MDPPRSDTNAVPVDISSGGGGTLSDVRGDSRSNQSVANSKREHSRSVISISSGSPSDSHHRRISLGSPVSLGLSRTKSSKVNMTINVQLKSISMPVMRELSNNSLVNLSIELSSKVMFSRDVCLSDCHNGLSAEINESVALSSNMKQDARGDFEVIIFAIIFSV